MRPEVRDAVNNINRFLQEVKYINISEGADNIYTRTLRGKDPELVEEILEHLSLITKEISKIHNQGKEDEFTEKYIYLSNKNYDNIEEFKKDFLIE